MESVTEYEKMKEEIAVLISSIPVPSENESNSDIRFAAMVLECAKEIAATLSDDVRNDMALNTVGTLLMSVKRYLREKNTTNATSAVDTYQDKCLAAIATGLDNMKEFAEKMNQVMLDQDVALAAKSAK